MSSSINGPDAAESDASELNSGNAEAGLPTAQIIAFPVRAKPAPPAEDRLARALASLNAALAEQSEAVAKWRGALAELKTTTGALSQSLQRYNTSLGTLSDGVSALHHKAKSLEQWADRAIAE